MGVELSKLSGKSSQYVLVLPSWVDVNVLSPLKVLIVIVLFSLIALVAPSVQFIHHDQSPFDIGAEEVKVVRDPLVTSFLVAQTIECVAFSSQRVQLNVVWLICVAVKEKSGMLSIVEVSSSGDSRLMTNTCSLVMS